MFDNDDDNNNNNAITLGTNNSKSRTQKSTALFVSLSYSWKL